MFHFISNHIAKLRKSQGDQEKTGDLTVGKLILPQPFELQLFEEHKESPDYKFYRPIFAGDFMVNVQQLNTKKLFTLELFGSTGIQIENSTSQHWKQVKQFEWSSLLRKSKTCPVFTQQQVEQILFDLYKTSPSSYVKDPSTVFKKTQKK